MRAENQKILTLKRLLPLLSAAAIFLLLFAANSFSEAMIFSFAIAVHEGCHLLMAKALKIECRFAGAGVLGAVIKTRGSVYAKKSVYMYLAGIGGNLFFTALVYISSLYTEIKNTELLVFYNLLYAAVNLVPVYPTDLARALTALLCIKLSVIKAVNIMCALSELCAFVFFCAGLYVFVFVSDNLLLMLFSALIFFASKKEKNAAEASYLSGLV